MTLDSLRLWRNILAYGNDSCLCAAEHKHESLPFPILLRSAAVCYAFLMLSALIWLPLSDTWTGMTSSLYHITPETVHNIVVYFLSVAKFFAIFVLLVPGLALHWTIKREMAK